MYNKIQQKIAAHARERVKNLFRNHPVPAHNFDHIFRVRNWSVKLAAAEGADVFLCELAAWLHDIGRTEERSGGPCHHELSYKMCRWWFRQDMVFKYLSNIEKLIILYAVRNHWNDMANKYDVAWILRDADKLDGYGRAGVKRALEGSHDNSIVHFDLRLCIYTLSYLKSKTARKILRDKKMDEPIKRLNERLLKKQIRAVKL